LAWWRSVWTGSPAWSTGTAANPGRLIAKPLEFRRPRLEVYATLLELDQMPVAVAATEVPFLPGYAFEDCQADPAPNRVWAPVRGTNKADPSRLHAKKVRLFFKVRRAVLYSDRFTV
jgi:hypothetical protein